jgi:hypothetical protein
MKQKVISTLNEDQNIPSERKRQCIKFYVITNIYKGNQRNYFNGIVPRFLDNGIG